MKIYGVIKKQPINKNIIKLTNLHIFLLIEFYLQQTDKAINKDHTTLEFINN